MSASVLGRIGLLVSALPFLCAMQTSPQEAHLRKAMNYFIYVLLDLLVSRNGLTVAGEVDKIERICYFCDIYYYCCVFFPSYW